MKLGSYLTTYTKIKSKCAKNLTVRPETVKWLDENIRKKFLDMGLGKDFLALTLKAQATKINQQD